MSVPKFKNIKIEAYKPGKSVIKKNTNYIKLSANESSLGISPKVIKIFKSEDIYKDDVFNFLNYKFDIIFLDPPYKDKHLEKILINIKNSKILKKNGILILHRHKKEKEISYSNFNIIEEKKYGISKIFFISF